jgi:predicted DNA-binding transcriptional regulator AlpA
MGKPLIDIKDLSLELKLKEKTIRNRLSNKTWPIPPIRIGRTLRWRKADVDRALDLLADQPQKERQLGPENPIYPSPKTGKPTTENG